MMTTLMYNELSVVLWIFMVLFWQVSESQFAYPVDPNPPQVESTISCFACEGSDCDVRRERGTHEEASCTGPRVACWTIKNMATSLYTRSCEQPSSIRQGVFCNRHMEGKEFCFAANSGRGKEILCGKCCLNDRCNDGKLQGVPDTSLQSCVACQGDRDEACNKYLSLTSVENTTYVEQCLLPNSNCWTERRQTQGRYVYFRGCQLRTCDDNNVEETCSTVNGLERCEKCCKEHLCNRGSSGASWTPPSGLNIVFLSVLTGLFCFM